MFPSYRNKSVDLLCKSTDWFLCNGNIGRWSVKFVEIKTVWHNKAQLEMAKIHAREYDTWRKTLHSAVK